MRLALTVVLLALTALTGCTGTAVGPEEDYPLLSNATGEVTAAAEGSFVIRVDRPRETTVVPTSPLPGALRRDGLRVVFSGELQPIPPDVRLIGQPIELSRIARAE